MKKYAVIVAGGSGKRMGSTTPKQFLLLHHKPVLWYTIDSFLRAYHDMHIVLVLPQEHIEKGKQIVSSFEAGDRITITTGGDTRFHSVQKGLQNVHEESVVFVHDGVRCLISVPLIHRCYNQALVKAAPCPPLPLPTVFAFSTTESIKWNKGSMCVLFKRHKHF